MRRGVTMIIACVALPLLLAGCSSAQSGEATSMSASNPPTPTMTHPPPHPTPPPRPTTSARPTTTAAPAPAPRLSLPRGGFTILEHYRLVAYYGAYGTAQLGVLGSADPVDIADDIAARAADYAPYGEPVYPTMELIATVARATPGADGRYSTPVPADVVERYLDVAHSHKMLLLLDIQPGRGEFLPQVELFEQFLRDPSVSVALDPEWKVGPGQVPATVIGSSSASSVEAVADYLSGLVARYHLPDKLLMVHEFTLPMLPDRQAITPRPGVEIAFHADGFGGQSAKLATWERLAFPGRPYGTGFKLFLTQDTDLMSPEQVMALHPRPDVVTYQ
jgi:hypothetical protein